MTDDLLRPPNRLPDWDVAELPEPQPLTWRQWTRFIGPGIVMMGIQIGGGEWLLGPEVTAKYGGGLMWIATLAIVFQVFYNLECGRYPLLAVSRSRPASWSGAGAAFLDGDPLPQPERHSSPGCRLTGRRWPRHYGLTGRPASRIAGWLRCSLMCSCWLSHCRCSRVARSTTCCRQS